MAEKQLNSVENTMNAIRLEVDFGLGPSNQSEEEKQAEVMLKMDRLAAKDRLRSMFKDDTKPYTGPIPNARNAEYERRQREEKKQREQSQKKVEKDKQWAEDKQAAKQDPSTNWGHQLLRIKEKNLEGLKEEQRAALASSKNERYDAKALAETSNSPPQPRSRLAKRRNQRLAAEKTIAKTTPVKLAMSDGNEIAERVAAVGKVVGECE